MPWRSNSDQWTRLSRLAREFRREPTRAEDTAWQMLRNRGVAGLKFRRQHAIDRFIVDFYCRELELVVEIDGEVHQYTRAEDALRQEFLESLGLAVLRFTNEEVLGNPAQLGAAIEVFVPDRRRQLATRALRTQ